MSMFEFAGQAISRVVCQVFLPPITVQAVNFDQLYGHRLKQMVEEQNKGNGETAPAEIKLDD